MSPPRRPGAQHQAPQPSTSPVAGGRLATTNTAHTPSGSPTNQTAPLSPASQRRPAHRLTLNGLHRETHTLTRAQRFQADMQQQLQGRSDIGEGGGTKAHGRHAEHQPPPIGSIGPGPAQSGSGIVIPARAPPPSVGAMMLAKRLNNGGGHASDELTALQAGYSGLTSEAEAATVLGGRTRIHLPPHIGRVAQALTLPAAGLGSLGRGEGETARSGDGEEGGSVLVPRLKLGGVGAGRSRRLREFRSMTARTEAREQLGGRQDDGSQSAREGQRNSGTWIPTSQFFQAHRCINLCIVVHQCLMRPLFGEFGRPPSTHAWAL